ncbi:hypothetical protein [Vibrio sp. R78045]|uniref:hypothetical protein n=1 Tax=Vibrio sp. R78045 TaxID=3093868 RepID=UPI0036F1C2E3
MTNQEFKQQISNWQSLITQANVTLSDGQPLPDKFFHVFLGVGSSTFRKMINGQDSMREIQPYTARTVRFINKLEPTVFLDEVRLCIPQYMKQYRATK